MSINNDASNLENELSRHDLVIVMMGHEEIINGGDAIQIMGAITQLISKMKKKT